MGEGLKRVFRIIEEQKKKRKKQKSRKAINLTKGFVAEGKLTFKLHPELNRFDVKDKTLVLNGIKFAVFKKDLVIANEMPSGLYIEANSVLAYIGRNLFGHDKEKYGIKEEVK